MSLRSSTRLAVLLVLAVALSGCGPEPSPAGRPSITRSSHVFAREPGLGIAVFGSGFVPGAQVWLGGEALATEFFDTSVLRALIPDRDPRVDRAGAVELEVRNPDGQTSAEQVSLIVDAAPPPEVFQMVSASSGCNDAVSGEFVVFGEHFTTDAAVGVDGSVMEIAHRSGTQLSGTVAGLTSVPSSVTVEVPGPGGGSASLSLSATCVWDY